MFHFCNVNGPSYLWDDIIPVINGNALARWVSQGPPPAGTVGRDKWAYKGSATYLRSVYGDTSTAGGYLANETVSALTPQAQGGLGAATVIWDELRGPPGHARSTNWTVAHAAGWLRQNRPDLNGRWGTFLERWNGVATANNPVWGYDSVATAINEIYWANGHVAVEAYVTQSGTCANGDTWLHNILVGGGGLPAGFGWLVAHKNGAFPGYNPRLTWIMGVTNTYMNMANSHRFMDYLMYFMRNRITTLNGYAAAANGGIGSYQWESGQTVSGRDGYFRNSWHRYCNLAATTPLYTVHC